jgi:hypothetical protein
MRSSLRKTRDRLNSSLIALFWVLAGLGILAVFLGRSASVPAAPRSPRQPAHPRYCDASVIESAFRQDSTPQVLDTETGAVTDCRFPGMWGAFRLRCSPWRDGDGQYQLVGHCLDPARNSYALMRYTFPAGRVVDPVGLAVSPTGPPCWSPDRSDRILFPGGDGLLYLYYLPETSGARSLDPAPPRQVRWRTDPQVGMFLIQDLCWPSVPAMETRLLATIFVHSGLFPRTSCGRLWWLQLSPSDGEIVSAERAIADDASGSATPEYHERLASVGVARDGTPLLAYLVCDVVRRDGELWVMPIAPAASGSDRGPRVRTSAGRKLAEGCAEAMTPAFSPDGRWVYASRRVAGRICLERFDVALATDTSSNTADRRRLPDLPLNSRNGQPERRASSAASLPCSITGPPTRGK